MRTLSFAATCLLALWAGSAAAQQPTQQTPRGTVFQDCPDCPEMVVIPAGEFFMGSPKTEKERMNGESPVHRVKIKYAFALGRTEVTQAQWQAIMGNNPSDFKSCGPDCPVERVSWDDIQIFIRKLNAKTMQNYRLPSESEWEYAARAGTRTPFHTGQTITSSQANFNGNGTYNGSAKGEYRKNPVPVGSFAANAFGLFDMHGNVWEWVQDCPADNYSNTPTDGSAAESNNCARRVSRGGSWDVSPDSLRAAVRHRYNSPTIRDDNYGFRLARTLP